EMFDIPAPDELVFVSSFAGGEVFRSGAVFRRGKGKVFYFSPGDQEYPVYHQAEIQRVLANAVVWARPEERESAPVKIANAPRVSSDLSTPTALSAAQGTDTAAAPAPAPELTGFPPLAADRPARVVVVGAGAMGSWWAWEIAASPVAELVGVADLVEGAPQR